MELVRKKDIFNISELKANKCYRISTSIFGSKDIIRYCILKEASEDKLTFLYSSNVSFNEIITSTLEVKIDDLECYKIEVIS